MTKIDQVFSRDGWYSDAKKYWENIPSTVDGMLGGLEHVHPIDVAHSAAFLHQVFKTHGSPLGAKSEGGLCACDCGAGIGRVSKHFLSKHFSSVDLVESNRSFLDQSREILGASHSGAFIDKGLEEFTPAEGKYDVIWAQWVLSHLTDEDLVKFVQKCLKAVKPRGGYLMIKENVSRSDDYIVDEEDSSVTRSKHIWETLFQSAGATILESEQQPGWPRELFPVYTWALRLE